MMIKSLKKKIVLLLITGCSVLLGTTYYIPEDFATIQQAVGAAIDGDSIIVSPGIYEDNILCIDKGLTLASLYYTTQNPDYISQTIIDGGGLNSVIKLDGNSDSGFVVAGFTIRNGDEYTGGGIDSDYHQIVEFEGLIIEGNNAVEGGGMYLRGSEIWIENVIIRHNASSFTGGGMKIYGVNVNINNSLIENNVTEITGGGIEIQSCTVNLSGTTIRYNVAHNSGGGIRSNSNTNIIYDPINLCSIYDNNVYYRNYGMEIYSYADQTVILDTFTVIDPTEYHLYPFSNFEICIYNGKHQQVQGEIYVSADGDNCNSGLTASEPLKTISCACSIVMSDSLYPATIHILPGTYSTATNGEVFPIFVPKYASLIGVNQEEVIIDAEYSHSVIELDSNGENSISGMTITHGASNRGGGINCSTDNHLVIENVKIIDNYAESSGGGIYIGFDTEAELNNVVIVNNVSDEGGGIVCNGAELEINDSVIRDNLAIDDNYGDGGGLLLNSGVAAMNNVMIKGNYAARYGGGICFKEYFEDVYPVGNMSDVIIRDNVSTALGGGIYSQANSIVEMDNLVIDGNYASIYGGGMYCVETSLHLNQGRIVGNSAYNGGGCCLNLTDGEFIRLLIAENSAYNDGGGIFAYNYNDLNLINVTYTGNTSTQNGGGIYCYSGSYIYIVNSILWSNYPDVIYYRELGGNNITNIAYCDVEGGEENINLNDNGIVNWLELNIDSDPIFADPSAGSYLLQQNSPCIDVGTAYFQHGNNVIIDLDEDEYYGYAPDMGALEYGLDDIDQNEIMNLKTVLYNYPNPFNPDTKIVFELSNPAEVRLSIYNLKGQLIKELVNRKLGTGKQEFCWKGRDYRGSCVGSGIYLVMLKAGDIKTCKKIILLK